MGSSQIVGNSGGTSDKTRWRVHDNGGGGSSMVHYLFITFLVCSSVGVFCIFYLFTNSNLNYRNSIGCQDDNEGSWGIGVFYGNSPFSLKPIEDVNIWDNKSAAWPIANPIVTCASVTNSGFPSNFVADPFLYAQAIDTQFQPNIWRRNTFTLQSYGLAAFSLETRFFSLKFMLEF